MFGFFQFGASRFAEPPQQAPAPLAPPARVPGMAGGNFRLPRLFRKKKSQPIQVILVGFGHAIRAAGQSAGVGDVMPVATGQARRAAATSKASAMNLPEVMAIGGSRIQTMRVKSARGKVIQQPTEADLAVIISLLE